MYNFHQLLPHQAAFGIRGLSRKEIRKHEVRAEMFVNSLRHAPLPQTIPKSESCDSLNLKVSRSFSGPIESGIIKTMLVWNYSKTSDESSHHGLSSFYFLSTTLYIRKKRLTGYETRGGNGIFGNHFVA